MASKIKVDQIEGAAGTTVSLPSGQTLDLSSGTVTLPNNAVDLSSAKVTNALPVTKGGTGLSSLGSAGQIIQVNSGASALEFAAASGGGILQLKSANEPSKLTTTSNSYTALSNLSVSITPASTSNKVLILCNVSGSGSNGSNAGGAVALYRNGSLLSGANGAADGSRTRAIGQLTSGNGSQEWILNGHASIFLDNPASTSALTYQLYFRAEDTTNGSVLNAAYSDGDGTDRTRVSSNITVMEIGSSIL